MDQQYRGGSEMSYFTMPGPTKYKSLIWIAIVIVFGQFNIIGQPPGWYSKVKQIKLLETKRGEVEKLFSGAKIIDSRQGAVGLRVNYRVGNVLLSAMYSNGYCVQNSDYGYNVEKDSVIEIEIELKKPINISRFGLDLSQFSRAGVEDVVGLYTYTNVIDGEEFYGTSSKLSNIIFSPSREQENLACKNMKAGAE